MSRKNDNARPQHHSAPDTAEGDDADVLDAPPQQPRTAGRDHATRVAAKNAPGRVTGRMYSQLHVITSVLDDAEMHLGRSRPQGPAASALSAKLDELRAELADVRASIPDAPSDHTVADSVKAAMSRLETNARLLEPATTALTYAQRDLAALKLEDGAPVPAPVSDVEAAVTDVLIALAGDHAGRLSAAVARLRSVRGELVGVAAA